MFDETRLERLIAAYFDQVLTKEEKRELETMLLGSARAREIFLDRAEWHGLTREWALRNQTDELMNAGEKSAPVSAKKIVRFPKFFRIAAGLAACLALGWWAFQSGQVKNERKMAGRPGAISSDHVALLTQAIDVEWETGGSYQTGAALPKGWLKIRKGTLWLDFYSGARVILEGPASIELLSQDLARLEQGKLTAKITPPAEGFTVLNANLRVIDRGTEFGMNVKSPTDCEVHVFDGEVELQGDVPDGADKAIFQGAAVSIRNGEWTAFRADRGSFADPANLLRAAARETEAQLKSWRVASETFRAVPDLLVYFDFESHVPGDTVIRNRALNANENSNGSVIGCDTLPGRWSQKGALGFAKTSDRVRFRTEGTTPSLTMMAWVRVDSLPLDHNALLSIAPETVGEIHWKLDRSGRLLLGVRAAPQYAFDAWERLESPRIVAEEDFGRWMHLATVIDGEQEMMKHFVNGQEVASAIMKRRTPVQLGMANLGNFDAASTSAPNATAVRNFNGRIDEFALFSRALTPEEIVAAMK